MIARFFGSAGRKVAVPLNGKFREDLYFRRAVARISLLPLRQRGEEVVFLAREFLQRYANQNGRTKLVFASDVLRAMTRYSWPGNVRELQNRVKRGVIMASGSRIDCKRSRIGSGPGCGIALRRVSNKRANTSNGK